MYKSVSYLKHTTSTGVKSSITLCKNEPREREPDVSMTIGMFLARANLKTFSSLLAIPLGLICKNKAIYRKNDDRNNCMNFCTKHLFLIFTHK